VTVTEKPVDVHAGKSSFCRQESHALCKSVKCVCDCHADAAEYHCEEPGCEDMVFSTPQGLGSHRRYSHGQTTPEAKPAPVRGSTARFICEDCPNRAFDTETALASHRQAHHGVPVTRSPRSVGGGVRSVVVELVEEDPPAPPAPKRKPIDEILVTVAEAFEADEFEPGRWMRVARFGTSQQAKAMSTRLRKHPDGSDYEWLAAKGDERLFVRVPASDG
jgi:hypothetical protein